MNSNGNERKYFIIFCCLSVILIGLIFGINSIMRGTNASFGGVTGELTVIYKVTYYANWPIEGIEDSFNVYDGKKIYQVLDNMYDVPYGYEFLGWGTESLGEVVYNEGYVINLSKDLNLYAIWGLVDISEDDDNEEVVISYGDTNLDGIVNVDDYLLIDSYILDNSILEGQGLINADVNTDGVVNNIDSDIIKQACLGTEGYIGFLPEKPILIYELYLKDESVNDEDKTDESNNNVGGNISSGSGNGSSNTGSGTSGSGNSNSGSGNAGNKNNVSSNKKPSVNSNKNEDKDKPKEEKEEEKPKIYEFKFIDGELEYAITKCDILQDGTCKLVLPNTVPSKSGFVFKGWSLSDDCSKHIIKETMDVNAGATYYACYIEIKQKIEERNNFNTWIIVGAIWFLSSTLIYRLVKKYKNRDGND